VSGRLEGRLIALGVTGSIAAYKSPELVRLLQAEGADVVALLSHSAARFVAPLALEALTRHPVEADVLALLPDGRIGHIVVADSADAIIVAPATAHWLAAMAAGLAGDVITATCLASAAPVVVAPAMDGEMYAHPATQDNVARLRDAFGYAVVEPERGSLASGQTGVGRLASLPTIVDAVIAAIGGRGIRSPDSSSRPPRTTGAIREADLTGRHIVVTAGGTAEAIDPVRFIGNRSTGRMGVAIAEAAVARGARVTLIAGLMSVEPPSDAHTIRAESTAAMRAAVLSVLVDGPSAGASTGSDGSDATGSGGPSAGLDALIMAAAVADFRPARAADTKLTRGEGMTIELEPTPDILAEVGRIARGTDATGAVTREPLRPRPFLVGFAAETGSLARAAGKLRAKGVDLLVANDVSEAGSGFGTDTNRVTIYAPDAEPDAWPLLTKREVADRLLDRVALALDARDAAGQTQDNAPTASGMPARAAQETSA
jgi:phosphopantothenoylcysteine decarboxylase/phosphopantothenate--cysteine ligase